ncbi:hypothetical protein D9615_007598 [Tricholomella constricta]|uniref:Transcription regulator Rua1 C-terminal domain-containing protein n=1 Tax=Tricholomella constricta TaxID=117010 RepID=A0A8H5H7K1_9AGAR|nr:hypothetical protein D9615_007598 [Tricholomella constricta]
MDFECSPHDQLDFCLHYDYPLPDKDIFLCNTPTSLALSPMIFKQLEDFETTPFSNCYQLSSPSPWISSDSYISPVIRASSLGSDKTLTETPISFLDKLKAAVPASTDSAQALTPTSTTNYLDFASPLTPLTPPSLKKNQKENAWPQAAGSKRKRIDQDSPTPLPRPKRTLRSSVPLPKLATPSPVPSTPPSQPSTHSTLPVFTNRTFPASLKTSPLFPLFYRRFPAISYFQTSPTKSPCALFRVTHPGGTYNPPRRPLDLYTPRFVRGKGVEKVGLCPICLEPPERGGAGRKIWLAMKFSAFKCYHMQYAHGLSASLFPLPVLPCVFTGLSCILSIHCTGISASTGLPFSPPVEFRITPRPQAGKNERPEVREARCHHCARWVPVEGIKAVETKVRAFEFVFLRRRVVVRRLART